MSYAEIIGSQLNVRPRQVAAAIELMDNGNTLPFIARYRKEKTGSLDEEQLRNIGELLGRLRALDERREIVMATIAKQGKLTRQLEADIGAAASLTASTNRSPRFTVRFGRHPDKDKDKRARLPRSIAPLGFAHQQHM